MSKRVDEELLALARQVGHRAAELVRAQRPAGRVDAVATKTTPTDVVTAIDRASERLIRELVLAARPDDSFLGEEGDDVAGTSCVRWIVDPIDGTVNFMYGLRDHAVSIAVEVDQRIRVGWVMCVGTGEEYGAIRGAGSWRWDAPDVRTPLTGPPALPLEQMLVATGFGYAAELRRHQAAALMSLLPRIRDIRRRGSAALDLVAVATGQVDAYLEQGLNPWDWAAGALIAREAGVVVSGLDDGEPDVRMTMAAHPKVAAEYFALVRDCGF